MRIIGLTGGIATGKSTVSRLVAAQGIPIVDGDLLSRVLTIPQGEALPAIRASFGEGVFFPDGTLDRKALGQLIFADREKRQLLDSIMQPLLRRLIDESIHQHRREGHPLCVLDMALLYEAGLSHYCDTVWCTLCPTEWQIRRIMNRDGVSRAAAMQRIDSQMPTMKKAALADHLILTHAPFLLVAARVMRLLAAEKQAEKCESTKIIL